MNTKYEVQTVVRLVGSSSEYGVMTVTSEGKRVAIHTGSRKYLENLKKVRYSR